MMDKEQLLYTIQKGEDSKIEFKLDSVHANSLAAEIVAFSNLDGGIILLGVDDSGEIIGVQRENAEEWVVNICRNNCDPSVIPVIEKEVIHGKTILVVRVPRGYSVVSTNKGEYFVRVGSTKQKPTKSELSRLFQRAQLVQFDESPVIAATIDDIDLKKVDNYLEHLGRKALSDSELSIEQQLKNFKILTDYDEDIVCATIGGLLIFGKSPQQFIPGSGAKAARYRSTTFVTDVVDEKRIDGTLDDVIERLVAFVKNNMKKRVVGKDVRRIERDEYPQKAFQEAIINAVCHRNYSITGSTIRLFMFEDRMEIYSPGSLPNTVSLETIKYRQFTRNQMLVKFLYDLGYIEGKGEGIIRMFNEMKNHGLPEPELKLIDEEFVVTFYNESNV